jgi:hypothetical protein
MSRHQAIQAIIIGVVVVGLGTPANASSITPPPVLSLPVTSAIGDIYDGSDGSLLNPTCDMTGANCTVLGTFDGLTPEGFPVSATFQAFALFMPNLAIPTYINPSASAYVSGETAVAGEEAIFVGCI